MGYEMPKVTVGQGVLWRHSASFDEPPAPAFVTAVYQDKIDCSIMVANCKYLMPKSGVRYITDPVIPTLHPEAAGDGVFELTERDRLIDGLLRSSYKTVG